LTLENEKRLKESIRKVALLNALNHSGEAQQGPVIGKLLGEKADLRAKVKDLTSLVNIILAEVNGMSPEEQRRIIEEKWPEMLKKEKMEEEKKLPPLPNASKYTKIVTRFLPNPDCVLHLGSARAIILSHEYARLYSGRFILRFEDTDPKVKRPSLEFYDKIRGDLAWLECKIDEEYIQSDRIPIYYEYAEKLLKQGNAYVCTCLPDDFRNKVLQGKPCNCRNLPPEEHLQRWTRMLDGSYAEGEAVVRLKTDLGHPNPAVRDWPALRIIDEKKHPHSRVGSKYRVWPLYNLAAGLDDHLLGITHIIRGKEHLTNQVRQEFMYKHLGWEYPEAIHYGRLKITGAYLSKSKIVQGVKEGAYKGWDDPRLATFSALRRRGITPDAIKKMIISVGPKTADVVLSWENLYSYNRKTLDSQVDRYFFVQEPIRLTVEHLPRIFQVKLPLHPSKPERGFREYSIEPRNEDGSATFWITRKDAETIEAGKMIRLMELFNINPKSVDSNSIEAHFVSEPYEYAREEKARLIHWIKTGEEIRCEIVMPDARIITGVAEAACRRLKPGTVIQFERFGFARIDEVASEIRAYYAHK